MTKPLIGKDGTHQTPIYTEDRLNGYKFLSSKDVITGVIKWEGIKYIPESLHKQLHSKLAPRKGDILLCKNGTTGIAALVDVDDVFDIYVSLALLRPLTCVNAKYLHCAINLPFTKAQFDASLKGIGVPNLHLGEIKKAKILVPPLSLQLKYTAFIALLDKSEFALKQSLEKLTVAQKALMNQAFRGTPGPLD